MLSTISVVSNVDQVPASWVFEYFCNLEDRLDGDEVKIKSVFKPDEKVASMFIFFSSDFDKWWFHDFSTGKSGDCIILVRELNNCSYGQACGIIIKNYEYFLKHNTYQVVQKHVTKKYRVSQYCTRGWNMLDANLWTGFNIGSEKLLEYNVHPLEYYEMINKNDPTDRFTIQGEFLYGYFNRKGQLCKIYRPKDKARKFIKVRDYIQGYDQLKNRYGLCIVSSMKDGLSLDSLNLNLDFVAPDSENSILSDLFISDMKDRYHGRIVVILDNDEAGIRNMNVYRERFNLSPLLIPFEKDISDNLFKYKSRFMTEYLVPRIDRILIAA